MSGIESGQITRPAPLLMEYVAKIGEIEDQLVALDKAVSELVFGTPKDALEEDAEIYLWESIVPISECIQYIQRVTTSDNSSFQDALHDAIETCGPELERLPSPKMSPMLRSLEQLNYLWAEALDHAVDRWSHISMNLRNWMTLHKVAINLSGLLAPPEGKKRLD